MKLKILVSLAFLVSASALADLDILFVGSSHTYSENSSPAGMVSQKAFNPQAIADELRNILTNDIAISETVNVVFEEVYTNAVVATDVAGWMTPQFRCDTTQYKCHSLAQYYMWPNGISNRHDNLRGVGGTAWDYVIITGDPYIMANFPGMYAEGVDLVAKEVASGTATPILLAQWPENSSSWSADDFNEIVYRVAKSDGYTVVPGGKAWDTLSPQDSDTVHPTPDGAYLAAASIYSEIYNKSATNSGYSYDSNIADHALSAVQTNKGVEQYTGVYTNINVFQMKYDSSRHFDFNHTGSSTEDGFQDRLEPLLTQCMVSYTKYGTPSGIPAEKTPVNFNYGRGNSMFEPEKRYDGDNCNQGLNYYSRAYGFPMQDHSYSAETSMEYGLDWRWLQGGSDPYVDQYDDGTDVGIASRILLRGEVPYDVRAFPIRLMLAKARQIKPSLAIQKDTWHFSDWIDNAVDSFLYALQTGRCAIDAEPADQGTAAWNEWLGRKIGYETAWQMSHMTTRAPGLRVLPTSSTATNATPTNSQTLSVKFTLAPTSTVTVTAMSDNKFIGRVTPRYLTFTPANYSNAQTVTVSGETGPAGSYEFYAEFTTSSDDPVYQDVYDAWPFFNTRPDGPIASSINIYGNGRPIFKDDYEPVSDNDTAYGNVVVDGGTVSHTFMITNTAVSATLYLTNTPAVQLIGGSGQFTLTQDAGSTNLAPEEFTSFTVEFDPASSGLQTTLVSVASTDTNSPIYRFQLEGFGVDDPVVGSETFTAVDYDEVNLGATLTAGGTGDVFICWGTEDGGTTSTGDWQNVVSMGYVAQDAAYELNILGLETNVSYWFRSCITNISGVDWSDHATPFSGSAIGGNGLVLDVDFDSLATGTIDGGGATLSQLNAATIGGSWTLEAGVTNQIQADASLSSDNGFSSRSSSTDAGCTITLDKPVAIDELRTNLVITFTTGNINGTGYTRSSTWLFRNDAGDIIAEILNDGGNIEFKGDSGGYTTLGSLFSDPNNGCIGTSWDASSAFLMDVEITINSTGRVDVSVSDHGGGGTTDIRTGSTTIATTHNFNRIETSWANGPQGIYFGEVKVSALIPSEELNGTSIQNLVPSNVSSNTAVFNASLNTAGTNDVYVHWGRTDKGTNLTWDSSAFVGTYTNVAWSNLNYSAQYLSGGSEYYYTFRAVSDAGTIWAKPSWKVTTLSGPTIALQNKEATGIGHTQADLNATLYASDTNYDVYVHWNTSDGVEDAGAWTNSAFVGSWTNVAVTNLSFYRNGLQNYTQYYYRFRGSNDSGDAWGLPSVSFRTTAPTNPPVITTDSPQNIQTDSVDIRGTLTSTGDAPTTVWAFWGDNDAGQGTWDNSIDLGVNSGTPPVQYSTNITGLSEGMAYYYRYYATNLLGDSWGDVQSFSALATPVVNNTGATNISDGSATLKGNLAAGAAASAWICWGTTDGGDSSTGDWANVEAVGAVTDGNEFSKSVSGLLTNVSYWYRCYATNAAGADWSDDATFFNGTPGGSNGAPVGGVGTILSVDFDSLSTGEIGNGGATLAQLNDATMGGTWSLETGVTHQIQSDAALSSDQGFSSRSGSADTGSTVILADPLDIDQLTTNVVITFTSGTTDGSGFSRKAHWKLMDGTTSVLDIMLDDGHLEIREGPRWQGDTGGYTDLGILFAGSDAECIGTTWDTSSGHLLDFEITIDSSGNVDISVSDHGGGGSTDTITGSITTATTNNFDRIQASWDHSNGDMGVYFGEIQITGPNPASSSMQNLAPANITDTSAVLNAVLGSHLSSNTVYVHWGTTDAGTNFGWDSSAVVGAWNDVISTNVSYSPSLSEGTTYYYTFRATNDNGQLWASPSWQFQTLGPVAVPEVTVNHSVPHTWLETQDPTWTNDFEAAATNDPDGDGYTTWEEYWAGTDPNDSNSVLKIDAVWFDGTNVVLKWQHATVDAAIPPIAVQRRFNLSTGTWSYVGQKIPKNGTNTWNGASVNSAFYRITVTNTP